MAATAAVITAQAVTARAESVEPQAGSGGGGSYTTAGRCGGIRSTPSSLIRPPAASGKPTRSWQTTTSSLPRPRPAGMLGPVTQPDMKPFNGPRRTASRLGPFFVLFSCLTTPSACVFNNMLWSN
jgi:hypothetical protein